MSTKCRFWKCDWSGPFENIFDHFESHHPNFIRESKGNNYYDFTFEEITSNSYLLCASSGLYWFCADQNDDEIKRGVFHIGNSEPTTYTIKFGLNRDGLAEYLGPYKSLCAETDSTYEVKLAWDYMDYLRKELPSRQIRLYFGEYDDSDDVYAVTWEDFSFTEEDEQLNKKCVENFTCCVCYEYIKSNIRFCENVHYVCLNCFEGMLERGKLRCPVCRTEYPYDCSDPDLDRFLGMVRFPDNEPQRNDSEHESEERQEEKRRRTQEEHR